MMATDPFDPNIDRALHARAAARPDAAEPRTVLTVPTLFGPVEIVPARSQACELAGACPGESDRR